MADMITPNFSVSEMSCRCCGKEDMDSEFMRMLQELRNEVGPLRITSGFRCEDHNEKISTTGRHGPHTEAKASDILISGERANDALRKSPSDQLQRDRGQPEGSTPQTVRACGHAGTQGVVELLNSTTTSMSMADLNFLHFSIRSINGCT